MNIYQVAEIIEKITSGFEEVCVTTLTENGAVVVNMVREQLYSGQDGDGGFLSPTYDDDPFFEETGVWYHRASDYKGWKNRITPPQQNFIFPLGLAARPDNVPNLFITGKFYDDIIATRKDNMLEISGGAGRGPDIVAKYGDTILNPGPSAVEYFNTKILLPAIDKFLKDCGY